MKFFAPSAMSGVKDTATRCACGSLSAASLLLKQLMRTFMLRLSPATYAILQYAFSIFAGVSNADGLYSMVGEVRDSKGIYYDFVGDTIKAFKAAGLKYYNEMILVTSVGSVS